MGTSLSPLAAAIAQLEGYGASPSNIPTLANNPGDLELGDIGYGTLSAADGNKITVFPTLADGQAALENQVSKMVNGGSSVYSPSQSIASAGATYGGSSSYGQKLAQLLGVDSTDSLGSLASTVAGQSNTGALLNQVTGNAAAHPEPTSIFGFSTTDIIAAAVGLIVVAAGVFSFKQTQTVIQAAGKVATKAAEVTA